MNQTRRLGEHEIAEQLAALREHPPAPDSVRDALLRALMEIEERRSADAKPEGAKS